MGVAPVSSGLGPTPVQQSRRRIRMAARFFLDPLRGQVIVAGVAGELERDLREDIAQHRLVEIVGSGVSIGATRNAPAASWTGLLKLGAARCRELDANLDAAWERARVQDIEHGDLGDMLAAAENVARRLGAPAGGEFGGWLRKTVGALEPVERAVLEALRELQAPLATTNYDSLIEKVTDLEPVTWRDQSRVFQVLRGAERAILHLHGHWAEPESVVLGLRSYEEVKQDAHAQSVIRALAMTKSLLFVGCGDGLSDPNFGPFLSWLREINVGNQARHYRLALNSERAALQPEHPLEQRIVVLSYGETHADLPGFLRRLAPSAPTAVAGSSTLPVGSPAPVAPAPPPRIVPRGLRSFEAEDHPWFLRLLPGPHDPSDGLPESLRFWKRKLEQGDPERTFKVGLIYGPSGCGKSSLVKAGLIPALSEFVVPIYLEASGDRTEAGVLRKLRQALPELPPDLPLSQTCAWLVEHPAAAQGRKVVLLLDQFEQWLEAHRADFSGELLEALRRCDGGRLQAVLLARDGFWLSVSRLLEELGVPIVEHENYRKVNLFGPEHAAKVLEEYGRAYECLPEPPQALSEPQRQFLEQAVGWLRNDDRRVVCVQLALFAEMLKDRP